ncbi:AAA domain-containing protein [Chitinophaga sp. XS-30]|uniref:AAA domain-containing protein n=1 Tax=Chitinophaga sp. XS-30 TaxID=2604421 RepID=UPI0011DD51BF|nr:AAA domain-containing protein [Chitinophaga sp. XS-30]QEH40626.1 AAA family ATPase [Chitinophaga sp. XS-30]
MSLKRELIYIDGKDETNRIVSYSYRDDKCVIVFKNNGKPYSYNTKRIKVVRTAISDDKSCNIFNYLGKLADTVGLKTEDGNNILAKIYQQISFLPEDCILSNYLSGTIPQTSSNSRSVEIFPFGFNISQKNAVNTAFSCSMSVIEGPPGTGKTQSILNIIANAVMNGQSIAVVSSNNSATKNVYEKLEKNGIGFIAALLGNAQNKKEFIDCQTNIPDLSRFSLSDTEKSKLIENVQKLFHQLTEYLSRKNELALLKQELDNIKTEYQHFQNTYKEQTGESITFKKNISADALLLLWLSIETQASKRKEFGFIKRFILRIKYGIKEKLFYAYSFERMIWICQSKYYPTKISEFTKRIEILKDFIKRISFDSKMQEYTNLSMQLLKAELYKRYQSNKREIYAIEELRSKSSEFIRDYPVIMSTTYSLRQSLSDNIFYDYVIIDESSQVDLTTGALALSCAKRAVIVGDLKQLPNVVDNVTKDKTDLIFRSFTLPEPYRYSNHSLLSSVLELFPGMPKTLLKEHYRCHPKIIEFCNIKFYKNQLVVLTEQANKHPPLIVYKTSPGNHARERMNQRQIDVIKQEIIPNECLETVDLGIVTPYRNQTNALQKAFTGTAIKADTVDKFQGRENEVIILSTVDNEISDFTDNPNRLNVAVSRAIERLILVVNGNDSEKDGNIADLIRYIEYHNFSVVQSSLNSLFDYLYKGYEEKRATIISRRGRVSKFDSENLTYALIKEVLSCDNFSKYDVLLHFPVRGLIKDFSNLNEIEHKYANNPLTHIDFLIYNKFGKNPVLAIEVDGFEYHRYGSQQEKRDRIKDKILEKYGLSLLRFATNGSNEKETLIKKLSEIQN